MVVGLLGSQEPSGGIVGVFCGVGYCFAKMFSISSNSWSTFIVSTWPSLLNVIVWLRRSMLTLMWPKNGRMPRKIVLSLIFT